jgi:phosphatidylglycerophosphate synthase
MAHRCIVLADAPAALVDVSGISVLERLLRTLQRCGIDHVTIVSRTADAIRAHLAQPSWARQQLQLTVTGDAIVDLAQSGNEFLVVLRGDTIFDPRLLLMLLTQNREVALSDSAAVLRRETRFTGFQIPSGLTKIDIFDLPPYSPALRRNLPPFCFSPAAIQRGGVEEALVEATQKGAQDFPAMLHAPIEKLLVARLCKTRVTPHQLTIAWIILALIVTALFATGHVGWGIALAFVIGILDGLDGKLARLRVETSNMGKLEHHFDSFFEVAWPSVLALHFFRTGELPNAFLWLALLIAGLIVDGLAKRAIYGAFARMMRPPNLLDRIVRLVGVRRNVFIWILLLATIAGAAAKALVVSACWQFGIAIVDLAHAIALRRRIR